MEEDERSDAVRPELRSLWLPNRRLPPRTSSPISVLLGIVPARCFPQRLRHVETDDLCYGVRSVAGMTTLYCARGRQLSAIRRGCLA